MAQLTDDCFAFNGPLLPVAEAEQLIGARVTPVSGEELVPLRAALGRVLSTSLIAPVNLPPFDNSAVDGFAVRAEDIDGARERRLAIVDRVAAGQVATRAVKSGEAVRIFTGADAARCRYRFHAGGLSDRRHSRRGAAGPVARRQ